jgi:hypothetical protein
MVMVFLSGKRLALDVRSLSYAGTKINSRFSGRATNKVCEQFNRSTRSPCAATMARAEVRNCIAAENEFGLGGGETNV